MDIPCAVQPPFFRDEASLPAPLPTKQEILNAAQPDRCELAKWATHNVGIVRDVYFVKYGSMVTANEGNALLFLEKQCGGIVPAPRLHAMYELAPGRLVLVMDLRPGVNLDAVWATLSGGAKEALVAELGDLLRAMRALPAPADFLGGICGGPLPQRFFWTVKPDPAINGPFRCAADLGRALAAKSRLNWAAHGQESWRAGFFDRNLPAALAGRSGGGARLTHGDLHPANVLVGRVEGADGADGADGAADEPRYRVEAIVDWATAGWYPEYWEHAISVAQFPQDGDWVGALEAMIGSFPQEAALLHMVREEIEF